MHLNITNTFTSLPADPDKENTRRQVINACYSTVTPKKTAQPQILHLSDEMRENLGISEEESKSEEFRDVFTGNKIYSGTQPYAMCYGGHQFGHWAGQLGDGRATNLFEVTHLDKLWAVQLKGAGETPYSRSADGLAVLRSSIREYLMSEAMFHLGVPTTRALSLALSGDQVMRDVMYDGNSAYEKGAIVTRVSPSFIRFGNFEILAANNDVVTLQKLADYTIENFYPHLGTPNKKVYLEFFKEVGERSLDMVIEWLRVGFVHGVMNTDNMSILGLTIDYGPYGWLEGFDFGWTPNTTDREHKRYRFGNQAEIIAWNLYKLANALYPLIGEAEGLQNALESFSAIYHQKYEKMMKSKLGLFETDTNDKELIDQLNKTLHLVETDMTIFFRNLANIEKDKPFIQQTDIILDAFYHKEEFDGKVKEEWQNWFDKYLARLEKETHSDQQRKEKMNQINPKYVLRNYMAQLAIDEADKGNYELIDELFQLLKKPYDEQEDAEKWFAKRPDWARHKVGCSMLSCSS
ncbi:protein adenylyltransferase SelO [Flammeovirga agarivorans]|uniref:Protein nucleotidyltransferase YdiU n=1 Tax=Flammeovirga agarivorans TaxID=2726742 RepID=A0A7X8SNW0_9BACT|nr:YdiU family protein [Flammeovirga agarivorans]NLR93562.1 YdiU family protein [Flammeovirga agarivorans]